MDETTEQTASKRTHYSQEELQTKIRNIMDNWDTASDEDKQFAWNQFYGASSTGNKENLTALGFTNDDMETLNDWSDEAHDTGSNDPYLHDDSKLSWNGIFNNLDENVGDAWGEALGSNGVLENTAEDVMNGEAPNHYQTYEDENGNTQLYDTTDNEDLGVVQTDPYGKTSKEIVSQYSDALNQAKAEADDAWQAEKDLLTAGTVRDDGSERTLASSLNAYDKTMDELSANTENAVDAQKNYNDYMNPYTQQQIDTANQAIAGASGAKLQSSATQNAIASNTASMQGSAYNNAVSDALTDASNTISNVNTQSQVAGNLLTADATPEQDIMNMNSDWADENLTTAVNMANTIAGTESGDNGIVGNWNNKINTK